MNAKARVARCHCGRVAIEASGEPRAIFMCFCDFCQRRTGTSFNLGAWYPRHDTAARGETSQYARTGDRGAEIVFHFCPNCGSNVFWTCESLAAEMVGIAVGCFVDPDFAAPTACTFAERRPWWLPRLPGIPSYRRGTEGVRE